MIRKALLLCCVLCSSRLASAQSEGELEIQAEPEPAAAGAPDAPSSPAEDPAAAPSRADEAIPAPAGEAASPEKPAAAVPPAASSAAPPPPAAPEPPPTHGVLSKAGYPLTPGVTSAVYADEIVFSGYAQAQYEGHQDSEDGQLQGGGLLNKDRFVVRRGRLRAVRDWQWGQVALELDGNTNRGPTFRLQKAEVSLLYARAEDPDRPPLVQLTAGQFDVPFGFELTYSSKARFFMERSTGSRALFPSEPDLGVRLSGGIGFVRYALAVTNGEPLDERSGFGLQDPNRSKDFTARVGAETKLTPRVVLAGGVSFNRGRGYHATTDATKNTLSWRDANENGAVDSGEIMGQPGTQATPAKSFGRWAMGVDLELLLRTRLGWSMLYAEAFAASNLDRGLLIADPTVSGSDVREYGYFIALTQEITRYAVVGFRFDYYDPNSDFLDKRGGKQLPTSQRVRTYAPFVAVVLPGHARLGFQWEIVDDYLARDVRGVPTDLANNQWTLRLQGMF